MAVRAFICGLAGIALTPEERSFLRNAEPWGAILFSRNVDTPAQLAGLTAAIREALGRQAPILVDQEGGRVQRLAPPHWPAYPPGAVYGELYDQDNALGAKAAYLGAALIGADLAAVGIDVDCLPIADLAIPGTNPVIGDRAYGGAAEKVAAIARSVAEGLLEGGVLPVLKHIPGHGRAREDSHWELPVVDVDRATLSRTDFAAFRMLSDLPLGMTAHVVFSAIDPIAPATTSVTVVREVIRGSLGFGGCLMTDDISMRALCGSIEERLRAAIDAGCDLILHCNGELDEMHAIATVAPLLAGDAARRADAALARRRLRAGHDTEAVRAEWSRLMSAIGDSWRAGS
jgi:beta-N-acetylhexosaminidase